MGVWEVFLSWLKRVVVRLIFLIFFDLKGVAFVIIFFVTLIEVKVPEQKALSKNDKVCLKNLKGWSKSLQKIKNSLIKKSPWSKSLKVKSRSRKLKKCARNLHLDLENSTFKKCSGKLENHLNQEKAPT